MEKYIVGVVLMDENGKIYRLCYFDVKISTTFCIDFVFMIQNVRGKIVLVLGYGHGTISLYSDTLV